MSRLVHAPEQIAATQPEASNWVSANAGSGKTHVLTQRVARLLLAGAAPQRILCLTYTKAAAAEMQTRLFQTLGTWAMEPEETLAARIGGLSGGAPEHDPARLAEARRLFARALETPGGLKIQTIHAFCDTVLRRFPLEAGVSPRFDVADDRMSGALLAEVRTRMAEAAEDGTDNAFDCAAMRLNEGGIDDLAGGILGRRAPFLLGAVDDRLAAHFGSAATSTPQEICRTAIAKLDMETLSALGQVLAQGKTAERPVGAALDRFSDPQTDPETVVDTLVAAVLTKKYEARGTRGFPSKEVKATRPSAAQELADLTDWALDVRSALMAVTNAARTRDLHSFAESLLQRLATAKSASGLLDFDDLVSRTYGLLTEQDMRAWVLYKLDQGIDHILVDEAQDTAPQQWAVIAAIAEEFLSGQGARPESRSLFVVGDEKQSIYSFQGAEPQAFGEMRQFFADRLAAIGTPLGRPALITSYRSAPAILSFVDAVFAGDAQAGLTSTEDPVLHSAHRKADVGRVDLWPPVTAAPAPEPSHWSDPVDTPLPSNPKAELARLLASEIARLTREEWLPAREGQPRRRVRPGDILVLVSRRDRLARGIIRHLKIEGVPVAGADRMSLTGELAVQDLLALVRVVLMPSDNLSLAALLRSPLCGVSEEALFTLAHDREGTLWQAVQGSADHGDVAGFLSDMAGQADYLRPFEFLSRALIQHDGRRRLLARLGPEAEDPIEELLTQALTYETRETPTLTGFLAWIDASEITVKREVEHGLDTVRVMTVHGAKGLEAPIVILPDTFSTPAAGGRPLLFPAVTDGNAPPLTIWARSKEQDDQITRKARDAAAAREAAERKRLLYVALTRAEDWLILCGAEPARAPGECWYTQLSAAFERLPEADVRQIPQPDGDPPRLRYETGQAEGLAPAEPTGAAWPEDAPSPLPAPVPYEARAERGSPSGLVAHEQSGGQGLGRSLAMRRGTALHTLLDRLGDVPAEVRTAQARALLAGSFPDLDPEMADGIRIEAEAVFAMPEAGWLFGPTSLGEVTLAIDPVEPGPRMVGRADRIVPGDHDLWVVDFKTDADTPQEPGLVPRAYLAQLGAYGTAATSAWPDLRLRLAILWTSGPVLMEIDPAMAEAVFRETSFARTGRA